MRDDLKAKASVKGQRGCVVFRYCEDELTTFAQYLLEEDLGDALSARAFRHPKPRDVHETIIAAHQDVSEDFLSFLDHPPHTAMQLVLEHALGHGVRKERFFESQ